MAGQSDKNEAFELFSERFPRYAFSLPSWPEEGEDLPSHDPFKQLDLEKIDILYLYGIANAAITLACKEWLQEKSSRRLIFLEPKPGRIVQFLQQPLATEVLQLSQVEIFHLSSHQEKSTLIQELSERYPLRNIFLSAGRHLTATERQGFRRTQLQLMRKMALSHAHTMERLHAHIPLSNLLQNLPRLPKAFYVNHWKNVFCHIPIVICGAGPSLKHSIEELKKLENRAIIVAGGSAIAALTSQGIQPHIVVAIDPNPDEMQRLTNSFAFEIPFLFSTRLYPGSFAAGNGPFGYIRSGMSGIAELWYEEELGLTEPMLGRFLSSESLSVTTLCVALANHLGCNPICFAGLDLAYTNNCRYADGVISEKELSNQDLQPIDRYLQKRNRHGRAVQSAVRWVMEAHAISQFAKRFKQKRWINCTLNGLAIKNMENAPLDAKSSLFEREWDLRGMIHQAICRFPMPKNSKSILQTKTEELSKSLDAVLSHLAILAQNKSPGKCALAEIEMKEELAYNILFFDIEKVLQKNERDAIEYWQEFQKMALRCRRIVTLCYTNTVSSSSN